MTAIRCPEWRRWPSSKVITRAISFAGASQESPRLARSVISIKEIWRSSAKVSRFSKAARCGSAASWPGSSGSPCIYNSSPNPVSGNQFARANQNFVYTQYGFGLSDAQGYGTVYDACNGRTYPPFDTGGPYTPIATYNLVQPVATFSGSATAPSGLYAEQYSQYNPNGSIPALPTLGILGATLNGATGPVTWTLSGQTQAVTTTCQTLGQPCQFENIATNANAHAVAGCQPAITAGFTVDGLTSTTVNVMILTATQIDGLDPTTGQHAVHSAVPDGYSSLWYFQVVDSCGTPLGYVHAHENFPNGFTYQISANWPFPTANDWYVGDAGGWVDTVAEYGSGLNPPALAPQSPLNATAVYSGFQQIYVDPVLVNSPTQVHYLDHGGFQ